MVASIKSAVVRAGALTGMVLLAGVTTACVEPGAAGGGYSGWEQREQGPFHVVSASNEAAVISAQGREVAIRPAKGFCLSRDSIETSTRSAVALIGDCALEQDVSTARRGSRGELALPRALPGIITVAISGDPAVQDAALDANAIESFLQSPQGKALIGRTRDGSTVKIRESRRKDGVVYLLVEDQNTGPIPLLSDTFWRAFVTLRDRLAVITINGFRARPLGVEQMLDHLSEQVIAMQSANRGGLDDIKALIAASRPLDAERVARVETGAVASETEEVSSLRDLKPTSIVVATTGTPETARAKAEETAAAKVSDPQITVERSITVPVAKSKVPQARPTSETAEQDSAGDQSGSATALAPSSAPKAPKRRKRS